MTDFGGLDCATELQVGRGSDGSPDGVDDTAHMVGLVADVCVQNVGTADTAVVSGNSANDTDGYWARGGGLSGLEQSIFAEEDQVADPERSHADETFAWVAFKAPLLLSTGAAVVFQFDSVTTSINLAQTGVFAWDMIEELRGHSPVATSRAVWDWNYLEIDALLHPGSGLVAFFSSPVASVAAIELRDAPVAEVAYEIGIDNLWSSPSMQSIFNLWDIAADGLFPLSIDQQLFPYDEHGVAVSAAGGLLATTVDEPGGFLVADTQLTLADASTLAVGDRLRVDGEVLEVSAVDANLVDTSVVRASNGTAAAPHDDLRRVYDVEPRSDWFGSAITATTAVVDDVATTLPVTLGGEFADGDVIRLFDETLVVSCPPGPCGNDLTVTRGAQGTTATAHPLGTPVKRFMPVEQWTLDSLAEDAVQRAAGSIDYSLVMDVPQDFGFFSASQMR